MSCGVSGSAAVPLLKYPLTIGSGTKGTYSVATEWNGTHSSFNMTLDPHERYWITHDGQSGSMVTDLLQEFEDQFISLHSISGSKFRVHIDPASQVVDFWGQTTFAIKWQSSTLPAEWFGFTRDEVKVVSGGQVSGSYPAAGTWQPQRLPAFDSYDRPDPQGTMLRSVGGKQSTYLFDGAKRRRRRLEFDVEPRTNVVTEFSPNPSGSLEEFYRQAIMEGKLIRWYDRKDYVSSSQGYSVYVPVNVRQKPWDQDTSRGLVFYDTRIDLYEASGSIE